MTGVQTCALPILYGSIGELSDAPLSRFLVKGAMYGLGRGAGAGTRMAGQAISDALMHGTGPLSKGPLSVLAPKAATMHVVKPEGGNWTGGNLTNSVDIGVGRLTMPERFMEGMPAQEVKVNKALNKWVTNNLGNYVKKQMATPSDPVRLMFDARTQEIESKFAKDMERANRTRERAGLETDPRRQANLMGEIGRAHV